MSQSHESRITALEKRVSDLEASQKQKRLHIPEYISVTEYAKRKKCARDTVYRKINSGEIEQNEKSKIDWKKYKKVYIVPFFKYGK